MESLVGLPLMQGVYLKFSSHFEKFVCDGGSFLSNSKTKIDCIIMNICQKQAEEETFLYLSNTL